MKAHLTVFTLSAILIVSIGMTPAFGQIQNSIVVTTDKSSYLEGETILVTGEVKDLYSGTPVSLIVKNDNAIVALAQLTVGIDKKFSTEITAGGTMKTAGTYTVEVTYGTANRSATTMFEFGGSTTTPPKDSTSNVTDKTVLVEGAKDMISYSITGGKLLNITPDFDAKSLIISIDAMDDGVLTLTIPRTVFDSEENGIDAEIFILIDGEEAADFDETTTSIDRTITIEFPAGAEEIEIIGTFVIPEFGTIAAMILAVAIISIIAVSAKSRLSIMPRY
ncbi:MAG: PEFG-CTERM sorting domain-containing protein [Candidatus Nitrosopumilus sp. bin_68KS]